MLCAVPKRWLSWDYWLVGPTGEAVADICLSYWRERGSVVVDGQAYRIFRQGLLGPFTLEAPDGAHAAIAEKPSAFRRAFVIGHQNRQYMLKAVSAFRRQCGLFNEQRLIGLITPASWFGRRANVEIQDDIPMPLQAFIVWLTLLLWKRESDENSPAGAAP